jgi:hypothetical protein
MRISWRTGIISGAVGMAAVAALTANLACGNQLNDQSGIPQYSMDYAATYLNADNFANITLVCIRGVGFATTTRDYAAALRVPQWDAFCATQETGTPRLVPSGPDSTTTP